MSRKEELRPAWLGVEFQPMTAALARALDVESATRGGARGLLVTDVYDDSPASRNGIKPGDILLAIGLKGFGEELDLAVRGEGRRPDVQGRPWRSTVNYLTLLLTQIGPGREARLRLLQGKEERILDFTIEKAPDDFDNADHFQETSIGLTVRELTYEVRKALRLPPDAPGVVVSRVESGSKAAVAQIEPYEIISSVNGQPAMTLEEFERLVRAAQATGKIEFLVADLGVVRIVELDIPIAVQ
jgi:serine protease Do